MLKRAGLPLLLLVLVLCWSGLASAEGFQCGKIVFGTPIAELDPDNLFVKYKEKDGVSYYNYTGPCRMGVHGMANPAISYAFVKGRIYARLIRSFDMNREDMLRMVTSAAGKPDKVLEEGEWTIYSWKFPSEELRAKIKYNNRSREVKSAVYYEPLHQFLVKERKLAAERDPAEALMP